MIKEIDQTIDVKQEYLRKEIMEKNYNTDEFVEFYLSERGEETVDLDYIHYKDLVKVMYYLAYIITLACFVIPERNRRKGFVKSEH